MEVTQLQGQRVQYNEDKGPVHGTVVESGRKTPGGPLVLVVKWDDGKTSNIYATRVTFLDS